MSSLILFLNEHSTGMLGALLTFEIQLLLLGVVALILDRVLKNASPKYRYLLWGIVLVKAFVPPFMTVALPVSVTADSFAPLIMSDPVHAMPPVIPAASPRAEYSPANSLIPDPVLSVGSIVVVFLVGLSFLLLSSFVIQCFRMRKRFAKAVPVTPETGLPAAWHEAGFPPLYRLEGIESPLVNGLLHPRMYVPMDYPDAEIRRDNPILIHERAHVRRRDGWVLLLQSAAQVFHPVNPLLWLANLRLSRYREQMCDEEAMKLSGTEPEVYGAMLLSWIDRSRATAGHRVMQNHFFETRSGMLKRFRAILHAERKMKGNPAGHYLSLCLPILLLAASLWTCNQQSPTKSKEQQTRAEWIKTLKRPEVTYGRSDVGDIEVVEVCDAPPKFLKDIEMLFDSRQELNIDDNGAMMHFVVTARVDTSGAIHDIGVSPGERKELVSYISRAFRNMPCSPAVKDGAPMSVHIAVPLGLYQYQFMSGAIGSDSAFFAETGRGNYDAAPEPVGGMKALIASVPYPAIAREAGVEGDLMVIARVSEHGTVEKASINWSKYEIFESPALETVKKFAWKSAMKNGRPVTATISIPFRFRIPKSYDVKPR